MTDKLWGGRFVKDLQDDAGEYLQSIEVDKEMLAEDIWGSKAHAIMLAKQKIIAEADLKEILKWLNKAKEDYKKGKFTLDPDMEDVHMNVERYLIKGAGKEYGGKLHTARSRNDQVNTDARLNIRGQLLEVEELIIGLQKTFLKIAKKHADTPMPGYTHTQIAQPITLGYWASAYVSLLMRDLKRLDNAYKNVNTNPMGSCALAGTSYDTDRALTAKLLGFDSVFVHSLDAISSRDFIAEPLAALAILMSNLSKLAEELVIWSTHEFDFITLNDSYAAGSSIMPQKKNPCAAELARAKTGAVYGSLIQLLTMMKGIPMGYNRDLQEDKPPLFDSLKVVKETVKVLTGMVSTMKINTERMKELSGANFNTATELANYLVREKDITFRQSHEIVGGLVGQLAAKGEDFGNIEKVEGILKKKGVHVAASNLTKILDPKNAVWAYKSQGSSSPKEVEKMTASLTAQINEQKSTIKKQQAKIDAAKEKTDKIASAVIKGKKLEEVL